MTSKTTLRSRWRCTADRITSTIIASCRAQSRITCLGTPREWGSMTDRSIDPTADQVRALRDAGVDRPVVMLNLLKFRELAQYGENSGHPDCSGEEAYQRYQHVFTVAVGGTSRAEVLYDGPVEQVFIGMAGTPETDWDKVLVVRYPSAKHFLAMMANEEYRATGLVHRYAGLERTVLLQCKG